MVACDVTQPSPLALEVLSARPYAFLDDAPLEERRTQAVMGRRWLDPESSGDLGRLDPEAIARVRNEAWPDPANAEECTTRCYGLAVSAPRKRRRRTCMRAGNARARQPRHLLAGQHEQSIGAMRRPQRCGLPPSAWQLPGAVARGAARARHFSPGRPAWLRTWTREEALAEPPRGRFRWSSVGGSAADERRTCRRALSSAGVYFIAECCS